MNKEDILKELREFKELKKRDIINMEIINHLISNIEKSIREEISYKSNNKTKVDGIKRVCKNSSKHRPILGGYNIANDGKYEITDSYCAYRLNAMEMPIKRVGIEKTEQEKENGTEIIFGTYPNLQNLFNEYNSKEDVVLDINNIIGFYKTRNKKETTVYILKSNTYELKVDIEYLKTTLDILGTDLKCSLSGETKPIYFENKNNECGIVVPCRTY